MAERIGLRWRLLILFSLGVVTLAACVGLEVFDLRQTILQEREAKMRDMVDAAERLIIATDTQVRSSGGTTEQAQMQAATALRAMRWGNGDYYGVYRWDGLTIVHGNPQNEGKNRLDVVDPMGKHLVAEIIALARGGGGTVTYMVPRASGGPALPKLSSVGSYRPWQWAIQAGVYLDDVNATLWARAFRLGSIAFAVLGVVGFATLSAHYQKMAREAEARAAEGMLRSERRFHALIKNATDLILICDRNGAVQYASPAAETGWGYAEASLLGGSLFDMINSAQNEATQELWTQVEATPGMTTSIELQLCDHASVWRYVEMKFANLLHDEAVGGIVVTAHDVDQRKTFEQQLEQQAFHDSLTGLPNRALFNDRLNQALVRAGRRQSHVGMLFLDLDGFKLINDSLGHHEGDQLLVDVARRLQASIGAEDTVARLGGDEFVILSETARSQADIETTVERVAQEFVRPFRLGGRDLIVTCSIGFAVSEGSQVVADNLMRQADVAMYVAKSGGKGRYLMFDPSMQRDALARLEIENDLRRALDRNELQVHYQPIVSLQTNTVTEVEALLRWQHPTRGLLLPGDFIPLAEETGLIVPLGHWVLEQACRQTMVWHRQSPADRALVVAVNLSPRQFQTEDLAAQVARTLAETGLPPSCLKLEITESMIMRDVDATISIMGQLKALGVQLAVDDFGTGYSALSHLKSLPLDVLKIDQSFIRGIGEVHEDTTVVQAIISLAKSLGLSVTGEGIENAEQDACLKRWACDLGQGYHYSKPVVADSIALLLAEGATTGPVTVAA